MGSIEICSPVALGPSESRALAPRVASLAGGVLGIRIDHAWRSWWQAADEIERLARERLGVRDVVVFDPESRIGRPEEESAKVATFAHGLDAAIVGLGT
ncbi:MAG TPA: hypothetical protein VKH82_17665 [Candidatus Binatia bacterium]|nr:hypothetical protein [Candidatus Binatia bacterium]